MGREADIQRQVVRALKSAGCGVLRLNAGRAGDHRLLCPPGTPDLLVLEPGNPKPIWMEVKTPGGKLSQTQMEFHTLLTDQFDQLTVVVRSAGEALRCLERGQKR